MATDQKTLERLASLWADLVARYQAQEPDSLRRIFLHKANGDTERLELRTEPPYGFIAVRYTASDLASLSSAVGGPESFVSFVEERLANGEKTGRHEPVTPEYAAIIRQTLLDAGLPAPDQDAWQAFEPAQPLKKKG